MPTFAPLVTLNNGNTVPALVFGTATKHRGKASAQATDHDVRGTLMNSLKLMDLDYVDIFLMHRPYGLAPYTPAEAWAIMEQLQAEGLCRDIGVSNFGATDIEELSKTWKVVPCMNQVEISPYCWYDSNTQGLMAACKKHNIAVSGFSSLRPLHDPHAQGGPLDPVVEAIAKAREMTPGQVLLAWAYQTVGGPMVTTSDKEWRMREFIEGIEKGPLTDDQVNAITEAGKGKYFRRYLNSSRP
ncbi:hypothetical protein IAT38_007361 [Cryptococcus sp. DSM 104549]